MKRTLLAVVCAALAGCEYTVPLVETPKIDIDRSVVGVWQRVKDGGRTENLLVLPLSGQEYLVSFPAGSKTAMFARGCLWRGVGLTLVQLDWFGTARAKLPEDNRTFQYACYTVEADTVRIRLLSSDVVPKDVASSAELVEVIARHKDDPALFRDEMLFRRVRTP
ncbi:MAG: hypothetical protein GXP31_01260 [Kiritimatiellaeota bacterium]|nr:hypothetical protein [Kiritimatiellota bacterium]